MRSRDFVIGTCALLTGGVAQAQAAAEPYATVGKWEIETERDRELCKMYRYYGSTDGDRMEGLTVRYHAAEESVLLTWSTSGKTLFPGDGKVELQLSFLKAKSIDDSWGSRTFQHRKPLSTRYFATAFLGAKESRRILRDLAANNIMGLYLGPTMMTALPLDAAGVVETLRECSLKIAAQGKAAAPQR